MITLALVLSGTAILALAFSVRALIRVTDLLGERLAVLEASQPRNSAEDEIAVYEVSPLQAGVAGVHPAMSIPMREWLESQARREGHLNPWEGRE